MIRNKTIKFNLDKPEERALWEWLEKLPHGKFSESTKNFWVASKMVEEGSMLDHLDRQMKEMGKCSK